MIPLLWLYILLVFLLLILIVLLLPVRIYVSYYKDIKVNLYIGFVKLQLLPEKEKKKVKKSTDKKTDIYTVREPHVLTPNEWLELGVHMFEYNEKTPAEEECVMACNINRAPYFVGKRKDIPGIIDEHCGELQ
jgi:hypothetical protein